ncbi:UDP-glucuronosyltransferase 1-1 [Homalodisca vitripennis]|nr:UDP-glucuronosyltransferase 1-1 [Homalodisca vitripennis]
MFLYLLFSCLLGNALCSDILAVFPHTGKSHFAVFEPLVVALAARGHRVTVMSFYPQSTAVENYTDISLVGLVPQRVNNIQFDQVQSPVRNYITMSRMGIEICEKILQYRPVKELLDSDAKFDLVIVELFYSDCLLSLVHKYDVPYIGVAAANTYPEKDSRVGTPTETAYVSHPNLPLDSNMCFSQRLWNAAYTAFAYMARVYFTAQEERTVNQLMREEVSLGRVASDVSLLLANIHHSIVNARPLVAGHVEVGGIHIHPARPVREIVELQSIDEHRQSPDEAYVSVVSHRGLLGVEAENGDLMTSRSKNQDQWLEHIKVTLAGVREHCQDVSREDNAEQTDSTSSINIAEGGHR